DHSATPAAGVIEPPTNREPVEIRDSSLTNQNARKPSSERSQTNEEKRSEVYDSSLSDLLSHYSPAARSDRSSVYEAMSASRHTVLYENCVQCWKGEGSCRLLRPVPPSRDAFVQEQRRNISESICSSTVSLQRIPGEGKRASTPNSHAGFILSLTQLSSEDSIFSFSLQKSLSNHINNELSSSACKPICVVVSCF
ncbi:hypothetical protein M9458_014718, partial [Cirrhinus mrigala]